MQSLERERDTLKHQLETQSHTPISPNMAGARRSKSFGSENAHNSCLQYSAMSNRVGADYDYNRNRL